jgi:hypothetical protein
VQSGNLENRETRFDGAQDGDTVVVQRPHRCRDRGADEHDERPRDAPLDRVADEKQRQRACADEHRRRVQLRQLADQADGLGEEPAVAEPDAEHLRDLAEQDVQRQTADETCQHRLREEVGEETEAEHGREHEDETAEDRLRRGHRKEVAVRHTQCRER